MPGASSPPTPASACGICGKPGEINAVNWFGSEVDTLLQDQTRDDESNTFGAQLSYSEPSANAAIWNGAAPSSATGRISGKIAYDIAWRTSCFQPGAEQCFRQRLHLYHRSQSGFRANGKKQSVCSPA